MRLEVPIHVIQTPSISKACLDSLVELPQIISEEEEESYTAVSKEVCTNLATHIHNGAGEKDASITTDKIIWTFWIQIYSDYHLN